MTRTRPCISPEQDCCGPPGEPDLVLRGHAHAGTFQGAIGSVPVYNVWVPVIGRDLWLFELDIPAPAHPPIH